MMHMMDVEEIQKNARFFGGLLQSEKASNCEGETIKIVIRQNTKT